MGVAGRLTRRLLVLLLAVPSACLSVPAGPGSVTGSSEPQLDIPDDDAAGIMDVLFIGDPCQVAAVEVSVTIQHELPDDLSILLTSPEGTQITLHEFDTADDDPPDLVGTYPTTLTPTEDLDALAGEAGAGSWTLRISDLGEEDVGTLNRWAITLTCG